MKKLILTIVSVILLFITGYFISNFPFGDSLYKLISAISLTSTALIVYYFLWRYIGWKKSLIVILGLSFYGILIESIGVSTDLPYGGFEYTSEIGYKIAGLVPWNIFFVWAPLVIGSFLTSKYLFKNPISIIAGSTLILLLFDLIFDPVAVNLNFWIWDVEGDYYGIPLSNFIGWILSGAISSSFVYLITKGKVFNKIESRNLSIGLFISFLMWTATSFWLSLFIPFLIGVIMITFIYKVYYNDLLWKTD